MNRNLDRYLDMDLDAEGGNKAENTIKLRIAYQFINDFDIFTLLSSAAIKDLNKFITGKILIVQKVRYTKTHIGIHYYHCYLTYCSVNEIIDNLDHRLIQI